MNIAIDLKKNLFLCATLLSLILLTNSAHAANSFTLTPSGEIDFTTRAGTTASQSVSIYNTTNSPIVLALAVVGTGSGSFSISGSNSLTLAAYATQNVTLNFTPLTTGTMQAALGVTSLTGDTATASLVGHATGNISTSFQLTPNGALVFNTNPGVATTDSLTITNTTSSPITVGLSTSGSNAFTLGSSSVNLAANGSQKIGVNFTPTAAGDLTGTLTVRSSNGDSNTVSLIGHSTSVGSTGHVSAANEVDFNTTVGQTECLPITISNLSAGAVTLTNIRVVGDSSEFSASNNGSVQIGPLSNSTITVCYHPVQASGNANAQLLFTYSGLLDSLLHGTGTVHLAGTATGQVNTGDSLFFLTTNDIDFSNIIVGTTSCQAVRISNPTAQAVLIDSAMLSGIGAGSYTVSGASMLSVAPHSTAYVNVCFSPTVAANAQNGTLDLQYTVSGTSLGGNILVNLTGNGIDSILNNGELSNCIHVQHSGGVIGPIVLGGSTSGAVTLTNRTSGSVTISGASISGSDAGAFSVSSSQFPMTLQAGETGTLNVGFNPTGIPGAPSYRATISLNATGSAMTCGPIGIHVEGVAVKDVLDTSSIDLGAGTTGNGTTVIGIPNSTNQSCVIDTVTLKNTTTSTITVGPIQLGASANFILVGTSMTLPTQLSAGSTLQAYVQYCSNGSTNTVTSAPVYVPTSQSIQPQTYQLQGQQTTTAGVNVAANSPSIDLSIAPNPTSGAVKIRIDGANSSKVEIFDLLGNMLTSFQGGVEVNWNGRDAMGAVVPNGAYIVRTSGVDQGGNSFTASRHIAVQK